MQTAKQLEPYKVFGHFDAHVGQPVGWSSDCFSKTDLLDQKGAVSEDWQAGVPDLLSKLAANLQVRWKDAVRMESIERDLLMLKRQVSQLQRGCSIVVPIDTLTPEPLEVIRPFHVTVEPYEDEYRASFFDANLTAFGETRNEAIWNLKDIIAATFEMLVGVGEAKLGPGPARQFRVLREFIRKP